MNRELCEALCERTGEKMQVTAFDELTAAALGRFLRERDCAVYRTGTLTLEASPLGSVSPPPDAKTPSKALVSTL